MGVQLKVAVPLPLLTKVAPDGSAEVVKDGISGILVPPKDPEALHSAMNELLGDREKMKKMGHNGKRVCSESFDSKTMIGKIEDLYDSLMCEKVRH